MASCTSAVLKVFGEGRDSSSTKLRRTCSSVFSACLPNSTFSISPSLPLSMLFSPSTCKITAVLWLAPSLCCSNTSMYLSSGIAWKGYCTVVAAASKKGSVAPNVLQQYRKSRSLSGCPTDCVLACASNTTAVLYEDEGLQLTSYQRSGRYWPTGLMPFLPNFPTLRHACP